MDFIVFHGAPGTGKTTQAQALQAHLGSPWFEFGWIPEFRQMNPGLKMSFAQESEMTFETLMLVVKNYARHGFESIILSDLEDSRMPRLPIEFQGLSYIIITFFTADEALLEKRILCRDNGNQYSDVRQALNINRLIARRKALPGEARVEISPGSTREDIFERVLGLLAAAPARIIFRPGDYDEADYFSYSSQ